MWFIPIPYFAITMSLFVAPLITFGFIGFMKKQKIDVEKLKYKKEILELEIKKQESDILFLQEENKKYDRIIDQK